MGLPLCTYFLLKKSAVYLLKYILGNRSFFLYDKEYQVKIITTCIKYCVLINTVWNKQLTGYLLCSAAGKNKCRVKVSILFFFSIKISFFKQISKNAFDI